MKRLVGRSYSDTEVQRELAGLPFRHRVAEDGYTVEVVVSTGEGSEEGFAPVQLIAAILHSLMQVATEWPANKESGKKPREVVLSVPGWFDASQRCAMQQACKIAGLHCLRTMNDLTAAALDYAYFRSAKKEFQKDQATYILFLDMGQCGFAASMVALYEGRLEVLSSSHDAWIGGREYDALVVEKLIETFTAKTKIAIELGDHKTRVKLGKAAERAKMYLSPQGVSEARVTVECLKEDSDLNTRLTLEGFEAMVAPLLAQIEKPLKEAISGAGLPDSAWSGLEVEMVGGSCRPPCVKAKLTAVILQACPGWNGALKTSLNADESVAKGCALQCALLSTAIAAKPFEIKDRTNTSLDLAWDSPTGSTAGPPGGGSKGVKKGVIPAGAWLPAKERVDLGKLQAGVLHIVLEESIASASASNGGCGGVKSEWTTSVNDADALLYERWEAIIVIDLNGIPSLESVQPVVQPEEQ